jgi:transposase
MHDSIAGIDVHKRVLMVVVGTVSGAAGDDGSEPPESIRFVKRRFGTTTSELLHLRAWLQQHGVQEGVMESTAQYWKPVWLALERHFRLSLAQAWSNRAPRGKKTDFKDAQRLVRRHVAGELTLSFVPDAEQRQMRTVTRRRTQLTRDRVRIQNQLESLLEETRIKLSSVVTDLLGSSGLRILTALGQGETDPAKLAAMGDARLQCAPAELADALTVSEIHRRLLQQHLAHLALIDAQMEELSLLAADAGAACPASWYTTTPPTTVINTRVFRISAGGTVMMSLESITKSASLPGASDPLIFSSNAAYAPARVQLRSASSRLIR